MNEKLDKKLIKDFPIFFSQRYKPMWKTAMCWGFECSDGWEPLIRRVAEKAEEYNNQLNIKPLNLYHRNVNKVIDSIDSKIMKQLMRCGWKKKYRRHFWNFVRRNFNFVSRFFYKEWDGYSDGGCIICLQVKEKWGGLRIYTSGWNDELREIIREVEEISFKTCEVCGKKGKVRNDGVWLKTLCTKHHKENKRSNT